MRSRRGGRGRAGQIDLESVDPRVICRALEPLIAPARLQRIEEVVAARLGGLSVVIEDLHDPHNGAAVLRSCEAFGLQRVHVVESAERFRFSPAVTQGCEKWMDLVRHASLQDCLKVLRGSGFVVYAAAPGVGVTLEELDFGRPAAILVGNEHAGLTRAAKSAADEVFHIPLSGMTRSLNLSVATAITVGAAAERRRRTLGSTGDLDEAERLALRARFLAADVPAAGAVVGRLLPHRG